MKITKNKLTRIYKHISLWPEKNEQLSVDVQIDPFLSNQKNGYVFFIVNRIDISKVSSETLKFLLAESKCAFCNSLPKSDFSFSACGCNKSIKKGFYKIKSKNVSKFYLIIGNEGKRDKRRLRHKSQRKIKKMSQKETFRRLWDFQNGKCFYCGDILGNMYNRQYFQVDHFKPISKEGSNELVNLRISCGDCNNLKNNISLNVFWIRLRNKKILPFRATTMFKEWLCQKKHINEPIIDYENKLHDFWIENFRTQHIYAVKSWLNQMFSIIPDKNIETYLDVLTTAQKDKNYLNPKTVFSWIEKQKKHVVHENKRIIFFLKKADFSLSPDVAK